jgi:hypothetical protein
MVENVEQRAAIKYLSNSASITNRSYSSFGITFADGLHATSACCNAAA